MQQHPTSAIRAHLHDHAACPLRAGKQHFPWRGRRLWQAEGFSLRHDRLRVDVQRALKTLERRAHQRHAGDPFRIPQAHNAHLARLLVWAKTARQLKRIQPARRARLHLGDRAAQHHQPLTVRRPRGAVEAALHAQPAL